jgi:DNA repair protein RecN (Recombination protein N)
MLSFLKVQNLAIIDSLSVEFGKGLNVLTGETGAGKSIIVDAVGLLLGGKGSAEMVRTGCSRLSVEGLFETAGRKAILGRLEEMGIDAGQEGIILRREVSSAGRSRAFVNGTLVTLPHLREIGEALADLHGQHQHQSLLRGEGQREALDRFASAGELVSQVEASAAALLSLLEERSDLQAREHEIARRGDHLRSEISEIEGLAPSAEEEEALRGEEALLRHAEEVRQLAAESCEILNEDDASVLVRLGTVKERLGRLAEIDPRCAGIVKAVEEARLGIQDALREVEPYRDPLESDAGRLEEVAGRLAALDRLKRKYGAGLGEVLEYLGEARRELETLGTMEERLAAIDGELGPASRAYEEAAGKLSRRRKEAARSLQARLRKELKALAMKGCRFHVAFEEHLDPESRVKVEGKRVAVRRTGIETIEFLISPNTGEDLRPLARIASGGELSRLMLAVRTVSEARSDRRTLIFDEVDAGIGGTVAEGVALRLKGLSRSQQVLCVTHLPQIAALADTHLQVEKGSEAGRTHAGVSRLEGSDRVEELARMIGSREAPTARKHAAALISGPKAR